MQRVLFTTKVERQSENEIALKDIFPDVSYEMLKIVAETYTDYMAKMNT